MALNSNNLATVDQTNWEFLFSNSSPIRDAIGLSEPDRTLTFPTAVELMQHIADDDQDDYARIQRLINERLDASNVVKAWHRLRSRLRNLHHFPKYRSKDFDLYHAAARAVATLKATSSQKAMVEGLDAEVEASQVVVPMGQILFHGRANGDLTDAPSYSQFLSTSLNPVVARMSAFRRAGLGQQNGRPLVYILRLQVSLPALWGQTGGSCEYELLLPRLLKVRKKAHHHGKNFDIVEADILERSSYSPAPRQL